MPLLGVIMVMLLDDAVVMAIIDDHARGPAQRKSQHKGETQQEAIVPVKLQFGQEITESDAEEQAGGKGQRRPGHGTLPPDADMADDRSDRCDEGIGQIEQEASCT